MEVPTPTEKMKAIRPNGSQDKRVTVFVQWLTGIIGAGAVSAIIWCGSHLMAAERITDIHTNEIKAIQDRASEDRAATRDQLREVLQKLDRLVERVR